MRAISLAFVALALILSACSSSSSKFKRYDGPPVTQILVNKTDRVMYLLNGRTVLKKFDIELGFTAQGHKQFEGDGKTPEGTYYIDRRNPNSSFHLSLGISYPNVRDVAFARAQGKSPGGDIFIHGEPNRKERSKKAQPSDWTAGCIAVTNEEMELIYAMVQDGTLIHIQP